MALRLLMDVHVQRAITAGLRARGVDVLTAQEDASNRLDDAALLRRATELDRVLFTQDEDFRDLAAACQAQGIPFTSIIFGHQQRVSIGSCVEDLHLMATAMDPAEMRSWVKYLPL